MANKVTKGTSKTTQYPVAPTRPWPSCPSRYSNHFAAQIRESGPHTAVSLGQCKSSRTIFNSEGWANSLSIHAAPPSSSPSDLESCPRYPDPEGNPLSPSPNSMASQQGQSPPAQQPNLDDTSAYRSQHSIFGKAKTAPRDTLTENGA